MTMQLLFEQLRDFRKEIYVPVILMGNINPVLQFGFENFCKQCASLPVDGIILPDLPEYEFENEYGEIIKRYGLSFIFLITPETSEERIKKLDALSTGFLYAVSSSSTTGNKKDFTEVEKYLQRLKNMQLKNPLMVGFGIKDKTSFQSACKYANGAIIGTAYIKAIEHAENIQSATKAFLSSVIN
jgi:tryptophan synthase alpha chain